MMAVVGLEILANEAGAIKTPEPMQLPTTIAIAAPKPSSRLSFDSAGSFNKF
ncbi:hypothetical protein SDC9_74508 [bioreactor metagenome]|uniref:Uncharacterized protein n=1 Tax=bioreactor metagenome TaxID=1076179 RepID=A0A644YJC4_9ZZZZ